VQNLANVYKSAWVTAHTHYSHHKLRRRERHSHRHNALLAVAHKVQKARHAAGTQATPAAPFVPSESAGPAAPDSPSRKATSHTQQTSLEQNRAPGTSKQQILGVASQHDAPSRQPAPQANTPQPLSSRIQAPSPRHNTAPSPAFGTSYGVEDVGGVDSLRTAHNLADRNIPIRPASPTRNTHDVPVTSSHMVTGPVNLADMRLRSSHQGHHQQPHQHAHQPQLAVSIAMDNSGVCTKKSNPNAVGAGAPAYNMRSMHPPHGGVNMDVGGVGSYGARVSRWGGRHREQETEDLQRQLQQLAEKESPVPIAIQPPMPIDGSAHQELQMFSRCMAVGEHSRDALRGLAPGEPAGSQSSGMSVGHHQPAMMLPGSEHQQSVQIEKGPRAHIGALGGHNSNHMMKSAVAVSSGLQTGVGHGDMRPNRAASALLEMKDVPFALDEVMDISPVI
jgi:hypothetical protein